MYYYYQFNYSRNFKTYFHYILLVVIIYFVFDQDLIVVIYSYKLSGISRLGNAATISTMRDNL